jgi:hypothetical protein
MQLLLFFICIVDMILPNTHSSKVSHHFPTRFVYIDLGSNDGLSIDAFLPTKSKLQSTVSAFDGSNAVLVGDSNRAFFMASNASVPMYDKRNYEIVAVEANPRWTKLLQEQKKQYEATNIVKSYSLFNGTGISTKNGVGHLILDCAGKQSDSVTFV